MSFFVKLDNDFRYDSRDVSTLMAGNEPIFSRFYAV